MPPRMMSAMAMKVSSTAAPNTTASARMAFQPVFHQGPASPAPPIPSASPRTGPMATTWTAASRKRAAAMAKSASALPKRRRTTGVSTAKPAIWAAPVAAWPMALARVRSSRATTAGRMAPSAADTNCVPTASRMAVT